MAKSRWGDYVDSLTIEKVLPESHAVVSCKSGDKIVDVLILLTKERILSCPVYDEDKKEFNAFVDIVDILTIMVLVSKCKEIADAFNGSPIQFKEFLEKENEVIKAITVAEIVGSASALTENGKGQRSDGRNPWCAVWKGYPLNSLLDMFSKEVNLHRVAVVDDSGNVIGIISQSRVIEFLNDALEKFPELASTEVKQFVAADRPVLSVKASDNLTDAFLKLLEAGVSGLAVVDDAGKLVGVLTASNLRRHGYDLDDLLTAMSRTVQDLLDQGQEGGSSPIKMGLDATLADVVSRLLERHIHRIFTVQEDGKPSGVVSLCDIISYLSK